MDDIEKLKATEDSCEIRKWGSERMKNKRFILPTYVVLLLVMFVLPRYSADGYSILSNTTSQLGAQNTPNAWIVFFFEGRKTEKAGS